MMRLALTVATDLAIAFLFDDLTAFTSALPGFERIGQDVIGDRWSFEFGNNVAPNFLFWWFEIRRGWRRLTGR